MSPAGCFSQTEHRGRGRRGKRTRGEQGTGRSPGRYPAREVSLSILDSHGNGRENYIIVYIVYENIQYRKLKASTVANLSRCLPKCLCPGRLSSPATLVRSAKETRHIINNSGVEFGVCHNFTMPEITYLYKTLRLSQSLQKDTGRKLWNNKKIFWTSYMKRCFSIFRF